MKVDFRIVSSPEQEEAVIKAVQKTEYIQNAIDILKNGTSNIVISKDDNKYLCEIKDIYYAESVDKKPLFIQKRNATSQRSDCMSWRKS